MSSILDALRKLEEERSQHQAAQETPLPIEPPTREPAPRRSRARRSRRPQNRNTKLWVAVPVGLFGAGVILAAVAGGFGGGSGDDATAMANAPAYDASDAELPAARDPQIDRIESDLRELAESPIQEVPSASPDPVLTTPIQAEPEPLPEPEREPVSAETPVSEPESVSAANVAPIKMDVEPIAPKSDPEPEPMPVEEPPADLPPAPVEREPVEVAQAPKPTFEPEPAPEAVSPPPRTEPSERYEQIKAMTDDAFRAPESTKEAEPEVEEDIRRYDIMTRTVRARLDIPELDINMLMLPNEVNPDPAALINYNKVYVGESIPDTQGRVALIGVDIRGIAVEVEGKRYYYPK